jgi:hypothetical protein
MEVNCIGPSPLVRVPCCCIHTGMTLLYNGFNSYEILFAVHVNRFSFLSSADAKTMQWHVFSLCVYTTISRSSKEEDSTRQCMFSACAVHVHVQCMSSACAVHVQCMCSACAVHVQCMCSACAVHLCKNILYGKGQKDVTAILLLHRPRIESEAIFLVACDPSMNKLWVTSTGLCIDLYGSRLLKAHS